MSALRRRASRHLAVSVVALVLGVLAVALGLGLGTDWPWEPALVVLPLGALALWRWPGRRPLRALIALGRTSRRALLLVALMAAAYALLSNLLMQLFEVEAATEPVVTPGGVLVAVGVGILVGGVLTALPEELVFRGVLLRALIAARGPAVALGLTSLLFGVMHVPNAMFGWELTGWLLVSRLGGLVTIGAALGWVTLRSGTIWVAVAWHGAANIADTAWGGILTPEITDVVAREVWRWALVVGETALLVTLVALRWPRSTNRPEHVS